MDVIRLINELLDGGTDSEDAMSSQDDSSATRDICDRAWDIFCAKYAPPASVGANDECVSYLADISLFYDPAGFNEWMLDTIDEISIGNENDSIYDTTESSDSIAIDPGPDIWRRLTKYRDAFPWKDTIFNDLAFAVHDMVLSGVEDKELLPDVREGVEKYGNDPRKAIAWAVLKRECGSDTSDTTPLPLPDTTEDPVDVESDI